MSREFRWVLGTVLVLLVLSCAAPQIIEIAFYLVAGWTLYLARVIPNVLVNWPGVATAAACLLAVVLLGHHVAQWLWRSAPAEGQGDALRSSWRVRWTLAVVALVVLMFVAGIGATGVGHQAAWLARGGQRMFVYGGRSREVANRVKCASNLKQIGLAIMLYAQGNEGRMPDSPGTILLHADVVSEMFVCPSSDGEKARGATTREQAAQLDHGRHCSYVYHGRGLTWPPPDDAPIACEPLKNHANGGMNILFGDGHVEFLSAPEAEQALSRLPTAFPARISQE